MLNKYRFLLLLVSSIVLSGLGCSSGNNNSDMATATDITIDGDRPYYLNPQVSNSETFDVSIVRSRGPASFEINLLLEAVVNTNGHVEANNFLWTQTGGPTQVEIVDSDKRLASVTLPHSQEGQIYNFRLTVTGSDGSVDVEEITWSESPAFLCAICSADQEAQLFQGGTAYSGAIGQVVSTEGSKVVIADQSRNQLVEIDLSSGERKVLLLLNGSPSEMYYQNETQSIYATLLGSTIITRYNLSTSEQDTFQISGQIRSLSGSEQRVYYTTSPSINDYLLYSIDRSGAESSHGELAGSIIGFNQARNELVAGNRGSAFGKVTRYSFTADDQLQVVQLSDVNFASFVGNIEFSSDGSRTVISTTGGNGSERGSIFDIPSENLNASNGAWLAEYGAKWVDFSSEGKLLGLLDFEALRLFDGISKINYFDYQLPDCGYTATFTSAQSGFTVDSKYLYVTGNCDTVPETGYLIYFPIPEF